MYPSVHQAIYIPDMSIPCTWKRDYHIYEQFNFYTRSMYMYLEYLNIISRIKNKSKAKIQAGDTLIGAILR